MHMYVKKLFTFKNFHLNSTWLKYSNIAVTYPNRVGDNVKCSLLQAITGTLQFPVLLPPLNVDILAIMLHVQEWVICGSKF